MERERRQLAELQAKRENSAIEFQKDIAKYLSSGSVPTSRFDKSIFYSILLIQITIETTIIRPVLSLDIYRV